MWIFKFLAALLVLALILVAVAFFNPDVSELITDYQLTTAARKAESAENWKKAAAIYEKLYAKDEDDGDRALALARTYHHLILLYDTDGYVEYPAYEETPPRKVRKTMRQLRQEAQSLFMKAKMKKPEALEPRLSYVEFLKQDRMQLGKAVPVLREAWKYHADSPKLLSVMGDFYKLAAENPDELRPDVRNWLYDWAIYYYRHSLRLDPDQFQPRFNLGVIYHLHHADTESKRNVLLDKAVRQYCNAMLTAPESYEVRYNLGLALVDMRALESGFRQLSLAVNLLQKQDRIPEAQRLAQQIQAVRNSIYYDDTPYQLQNENMEPWLQSCLKQAEATP